MPRKNRSGGISETLITRSNAIASDMGIRKRAISREAIRFQSFRGNSRRTCGEEGTRARFPAASRCRRSRRCRRRAGCGAASRGRPRSSARSPSPASPALSPTRSPPQRARLRTPCRPGGRLRRLLKPERTGNTGEGEEHAAGRGGGGNDESLPALLRSY